MESNELIAKWEHLHREIESLMPQYRVLPSWSTEWVQIKLVIDEKCSAQLEIYQILLARAIARTPGEQNPYSPYREFSFPEGVFLFEFDFSTPIIAHNLANRLEWGARAFRWREGAQDEMKSILGGYT